MEKISIEKIRCSHPLSFYACWMVVLWWMTLSIVTWGYCPLLDLIGLMGFVVDDIEYCDMGILSFT